MLKSRTFTADNGCEIRKINIDGTWLSVVEIVEIFNDPRKNLTYQALNARVKKGVETVEELTRPVRKKARNGEGRQCNKVDDIITNYVYDHGPHPERKKGEILIGFCSKIFFSKMPDFWKTRRLGRLWEPAWDSNEEEKLPLFIVRAEVYRKGWAVVEI